MPSPVSSDGATPLIRWVGNAKQIFVKHGGQLIPVVSFFEAVNRCKELNDA